MKHPLHRPGGFTLTELLVVIAIIAVLMGLLFPVIGAVKEAGKKTAATAQCVQVVTALKAFSTEYGFNLGPTSSSDYTTGTSSNNTIYDELRAKTIVKNTRSIKFFTGKDAKDTTPTEARDGYDSSGNYRDPWGNTYMIRVDGDYDNKVTNPYSGTVDADAIAWSIGKDKKQDANNGSGGPANDDVTSFGK